MSPAPTIPINWQLYSLGVMLESGIPSSPSGLSKILLLGCRGKEIKSLGRLATGVSRYAHLSTIFLPVEYHTPEFPCCGYVIKGSALASQCRRGLPLPGSGLRRTTHSRTPKKYWRALSMDQSRGHSRRGMKGVSTKLDSFIRRFRRRPTYSTGTAHRDDVAYCKGALILP